MAGHFCADAAEHTFPRAFFGIRDPEVEQINLCKSVKTTAAPAAPAVRRGLDWKIEENRRKRGKTIAIRSTIAAPPAEDHRSKGKLSGKCDRE